MADVTGAKMARKEGGRGERDSRFLNTKFAYPMPKPLAWQVAGRARNRARSILLDGLRELDPLALCNRAVGA